MHISKHLVAAAAIAFLALFGAVFFLLGRESRRHPAPAPVISQAAVQAADPAPALPAAPLPTSSPPLPTSTAPIAAAAIEPAPLPRVRPSAPPVPAARASAPPAPDDAAAARDYFTQMQAIQTISGSTDTNEAANKLLTASMTGDTSGFDELIKAAQAGAAQARAIQPPPCCVAYHEHLLGMLAESVTMVQQIKRAMATSDSAGLAGLAASGSSLQTRASALEAEAKQIKAGLGIR